MRAAAARLYEEAFGAKFAVAIRDVDARVRFIEFVLQPNCAFVALVDGKLAGVAGMHSLTDGAFMGGKVDYADLTTKLGWIRGTWAAIVFSFYERKPAADELLMDGIAVCADMRGQGIGGGLLDAIVQYASTTGGFSRVSLDVIDSNPNAQRLYIRKGFCVVHTKNYGWLKWLLGFGAATRMHLALPHEKLAD